MKIKLIYILSLFILMGINNELYSQIYIIANKSVKDTNITKSKVIDIYTLNRLYWEDGSKIVLYDYKGDNSLKIKFFNFLNLSSANLQKIWLRKQFSGKAMPPRTYKTEKEIIEEVSSIPGAIAYVSTKNLPDNIIILAKIE